MLVIAEKLFLAQAAYPVLTRLYPGETFEYLQSHPFGLPFVFDYPSKLSWHDYPAWLPARYRLNPDAQRGAILSPKPAQHSLYNYEELSQHTSAIALCEPSYSSILATERMRQLLQELGKFEQWLGTFTFYSLLEEDIHVNLTSPRLTSDAVALACAGAQLKADFDFSFLVNASGLLTRCYHAAGGQVSSPVLSKYMVQTLYVIRNWADTSKNEPPVLLTESRLYAALAKWEGTGKYSTGRIVDRLSIGSCASRNEIISELEKLGLISLEPKKVILTPVGLEFLKRLHPDCEDPDLPYRLHHWQTNPKESQQAAQRYIRTWFGKQKRFMG